MRVVPSNNSVRPSKLPEKPSGKWGGRIVTILKNLILSAVHAIFGTSKAPSKPIDKKVRKVQKTDISAIKVKEGSKKPLPDPKPVKKDVLEDAQLGSFFEEPVFKEKVKEKPLIHKQKAEKKQKVEIPKDMEFAHLEDIFTEPAPKKVSAPEAPAKVVSKEVDFSSPLTFKKLNMQNVPDTGACLLYAFAIGAKKLDLNDSVIKNWKIGAAELDQDFSKKLKDVDVVGQQLRDQAADFIKDYSDRGRLVEGDPIHFDIFNNSIPLFNDGINRQINDKKRALDRLKNAKAPTPKEIAAKEKELRKLNNKLNDKTPEEQIEKLSSEIFDKENELEALKKLKPFSQKDVDTKQHEIDELEKRLIGSGEIDKYLAESRRSQFYCSPAHIMALAKHYNVTIVVWTSRASPPRDNEYLVARELRPIPHKLSDGKQEYWVPSITNGDGRPKPVINLAFVHGNHFEYVEPA